MSIQRLVPLTLGWQELDRCIALDGYPPGEGDRIPIPGWVIERDGGGLILYDTGYDPTAGASELAFPGFPPPEVVALPDALAAAGFPVEAVMMPLRLSSSLSRETRLTPPRTLNAPVGWKFSCLTHVSAPVRADRPG